MITKQLKLCFHRQLLVFRHVASFIWCTTGVELKETDSIRHEHTSDNSVSAGIRDSQFFTMANDKVKQPIWVSCCPDVTEPLQVNSLEFQSTTTDNNTGNTLKELSTWMPKAPTTVSTLLHDSSAVRIRPQNRCQNYNTPCMFIILCLAECLLAKVSRRNTYGFHKKLPIVSWLHMLRFRCHT